MTIKWEQFQTVILNKIEEINKNSKRALKTKIPKNKDTIEDIINKQVSLYNSLTNILAKAWDNLDSSQKSFCNEHFVKIRDKVVRTFQKLNCHYYVPHSCLKIIDITVELISDNESDSEEMALNAVEFFNLASKIVPNEFDGKPDKLQSFIDSLTLLSTFVTEEQANAIAFVKTRLTGKARTLINNPVSIQAIIDTLQHNIKGDSSSLLNAKLSKLRQNGKDTVNFANEVEKLAEKLNAAYIAEGMSSQLAQKYVTESAVKAMSQNASNNNTKLIIAAGNFSTPQEAITKFVSVDSTYDTQENVYYMQGKNNLRGRFSTHMRGQPRNMNRPNYPQNWRNNYNNQQYNNNPQTFRSPRGRRQRGNSSYNHQRYNNAYNNYGNYNQRSNVRLCAIEDGTANATRQQTESENFH